MVQNKKENKLNKKEVKMGNKIRGKNGEKQRKMVEMGKNDLRVDNSKENLITQEINQQH